MCLAIPFKIKKIEGQMATVEVSTLSQEISIGLTPDVKVDDWVLVHAGYAIHQIDEEEAAETIGLLGELDENNI